MARQSTVQEMGERLVRSCWVGLAALALACGAAEDPGLQTARDEGTAALGSGDDSMALKIARRALTTLGDDGELLLVAGTASLNLKRFSDAVDLAGRGLSLSGAPALTANLRWLQGKALLGRFNDLHDEDDWRRANVALASAVLTGDHRIDAALMLVLLQDMSDRGDAERQQRYARELISLAPGSPEATKVTAYLKQQGIDL